MATAIVMHWSAALRVDRRVARSLAGPLLLLIGAGAIDFWFVAAGVVGAGASLLVAIAAAGALLATLKILFDEGRGCGMRLKASILFGYAFLVGINVVLEAAGLTAAYGANNLGRSMFAASSQATLEALDATADGFGRFATAVGNVADHSAERAQVEKIRGNTCGVSKPGEDGPVSRLRLEDAGQFASMGKRTDELAEQAREQSSTVRQAIADYTVKRHRQTVKSIGEASETARSLAASGELQAFQDQLRIRLEQVRFGRPDSRSGQLVFCNDETFSGDIGTAVDIKLPPVPPTYEAPPIPNEESSVTGLIAELLKLLTGDTANLGPWKMPLVFAPIPSCFFFLALVLLRRRLAELRGVSGAIADRLGIDGGLDALLAVADRVSADPAFLRLRQLHWVRQTRWSAIHFLVVPVDLHAELMVADQLVRAGHVLLRTEVNGADLAEIAPLREVDRTARFIVYTLKQGRWAELETEALRAAAVADEATPTATSRAA